MNPAQGRASFDLKGTTLPLTAVMLKTTDLITLASDLESRMAESPDYFDHDPVVIDLAAVRADDAPVNFDSLIAVLRNYHMVPVAARGGGPKQMLAARAAGLCMAPDTPVRAGGSRVDADAGPGHGPAEVDAPVTGAAGPAAPLATPAAAAAVVAETEAVDPLAGAVGTIVVEPAVEIREVVVEPAIEIREVIREVVREVEVPVGNVPTLVIDKPLRSGQQVYARGADLIVLAAVSFGAEVMADGNIHVYGPLRGRALAGVLGDTNARIFTTCLEPQLISIAGIYRTTEVPIADDVAGKPAQVKLVGEKIIIDPL
ncbi:MAG: septum site-determining protein MinC [Burkholderiaceae bacterium]